MGRKKKAAETPQEATVPALAPVVSPASVEGEQKMLMAVEVEPDRDVLRKDAADWALEGGFKGPLMMDGPHREDYPRYGHGYSLTLREQEGKQRLATARYSSEGKRKYWSVDGMVTG